jgi:polygalacturonase
LRTEFLGWAIVSLAFLCLRAESTQADVCNPRDFGAVGDGMHDDTDAVQAALDSCIGGGTVCVSPGTYLIRPIVINGNGVTLRLDVGATLLGSPNLIDYASNMNLILANGKADIAILGGGTIDGSGAAFWGHEPRPRLIRLRRCERVLVQGVTLQNSPTFHLVPEDSDDVTIDSVTILAPPTSPNTDGIDPGGRNINISNCYIDTGDDNIAIKAGTGVHVNGVTVHDCTFLHGHGLSMGSELNGGVENFVAQNIRFDGTDNGLRIKTDRTRGGIVNNVSYDTITMHNVRRIIDIAGYYPESTIPRPFTDPPQPITDTTPQYSNILISNLTSDGGGNGTPNGAFFIGVPEAPITRVLLQNVTLARATRPFELRNVEIQRCNVTINSGFQIDENVTITDGCGDEGYSLSLCSDSETAEQGGAASYQVILTPSPGFQGAVSFRVSGLPGTWSSFDPPVVWGWGSTTLTVLTSNLTPVGTYPLTITATSGDTGRLNRISVASLAVLEASPLEAHSK